MEKCALCEKGYEGMRHSALPELQQNLFRGCGAKRHLTGVDAAQDAGTGFLVNAVVNGVGQALEQPGERLVEGRIGLAHQQLRV